jgi:hypothetical protein
MTYYQFGYLLVFGLDPIFGSLDLGRNAVYHRFQTLVYELENTFHF